MAQRFRARVSGLGVLAPVAFAVALFCCAARSAFAASCAVVHHPPLSDPDKALLAADYTKAESLYRSALAANPGDADLTVGLVHALLRDQKVQEAADTVKAALDAAPKSAALITLRGEVELRQGEPWTAAQTANDSFKMDPCSPRTQLLIADLARINSLYATARQALLAAHQTRSRRSGDSRGVAVHASAQAEHRGTGGLPGCSAGRRRGRVAPPAPNPRLPEKAGSGAAQALPAGFANRHCRDSVCPSHSGCEPHRGIWPGCQAQ